MGQHTGTLFDRGRLADGAQPGIGLGGDGGSAQDILAPQVKHASQRWITTDHHSIPIQHKQSIRHITDDGVGAFFLRKHA